MASNTGDAQSKVAHKTNASHSIRSQTNARKNVIKHSLESPFQIKWPVLPPPARTEIMSALIELVQEVSHFRNYEHAMKRGRRKLANFEVEQSRTKKRKREGEVIDGESRDTCAETGLASRMDVDGILSAGQASSQAASSHRLTLRSNKTYQIPDHFTPARYLPNPLPPPLPRPSVLPFMVTGINAVTKSMEYTISEGRRILSRATHREGSKAKGPAVTKASKSSARRKKQIEKRKEEASKKVEKETENKNKADQSKIPPLLTASLADPEKDSAQNSASFKWLHDEYKRYLAQPNWHTPDLPDQSHIHPAEMPNPPDPDDTPAIPLSSEHLDRLLRITDPVFSRRSFFESAESHRHVVRKIFNDEFGAEARAILEFFDTKLVNKLTKGRLAEEKKDKAKRRRAERKQREEKRKENEAETVAVANENKGGVVSPHPLPETEAANTVEAQETENAQSAEGQNAQSTDLDQQAKASPSKRPEDESGPGDDKEPEDEEDEQPLLRIVFVCKSDINPPQLVGHIPSMTCAANGVLDALNASSPSSASAEEDEDEDEEEPTDPSDMDVDPSKPMDAVAPTKASGLKEFRKGGEVKSAQRKLPEVYLVQLEQGAELVLAEALGLRRVAALGFSPDTPGIDTLLSILAKYGINPPRSPWLNPLLPLTPPSLNPTHIKHLRTTQPANMKAATEERKAKRKQKAERSKARRAEERKAKVEERKKKARKDKRKAKEKGQVADPESTLIPTQTQPPTAAEDAEMKV